MIKSVLILLLLHHDLQRNRADHPARFIFAVVVAADE